MGKIDYGWMVGWERGRGWGTGVSRLFYWELYGKDKIYIKDMINTGIVCTKQRKKLYINKK